MRVLVVHPNMRIMGGGERVAIHTIRAVQEMGHEVTLMSEEFDKKVFEDFFGCNGIFDSVSQLTYSPFSPMLGPVFLLYRRLRYYQRLFQRLLSQHSRFDLVIGTQDVGYAPSTSAPTVQYCYTTEYFRHLQTHPSSPFWRLYYRPARMFYRNRVKRITRLLSTSNYTRELIRGYWRRDSMTLHPPCPVELYNSIKEQKENLAITVGRIVPDKRMEVFLELARRLPMFNFSIIGSVPSRDDAYYNSLRNRAPGNASIVLLPLRRAKDLLGKAKVYVHCMENEHFGITIVEAMAAGCVPVVHDSGGPREIVTEDVGFRWRDIQEAGRQISTVMGDGKLRERLSQSSAKRASLFSSEVFESSLIRILRAFEA